MHLFKQKGDSALWLSVFMERVLWKFDLLPFCSNVPHTKDAIITMKRHARRQQETQLAFSKTTASRKVFCPPPPQTSGWNRLRDVSFIHCLPSNLFTASPACDIYMRSDSVGAAFRLSLIQSERHPKNPGKHEGCHTNSAWDIFAASALDTVVLFEQLPSILCARQL